MRKRDILIALLFVGMVSSQVAISVENNNISKQMQLSEAQTNKILKQYDKNNKSKDANIVKLNKTVTNITHDNNILNNKFNDLQNKLDKFSNAGAF